MSLTQKLDALKVEKSRYASILDWIASFSTEEQDLIWRYLDDPQYKNFTLLGIFKDEGAPFGKESFVNFRKEVLAGTVKRAVK